MTSKLPIDLDSYHLFCRAYGKITEIVEANGSKFVKSDKVRLLDEIESFAGNDGVVESFLQRFARREFKPKVGNKLKLYFQGDRYLHNGRVLESFRESVGKMLDFIGELKQVEMSEFPNGELPDGQLYCRKRIKVWMAHEWMMFLFTNILKAKLPHEIFQFLVDKPFAFDEEQRFSELRALDAVRKEERTFYQIQDPEIQPEVTCVINWDRSQVVMYDEDCPIDLT